MTVVLCVCVAVGLSQQFLGGPLTPRQRLVLTLALLIPVPGVAIAILGGRMWVAILVTLASAIGFLAFLP